MALSYARPTAADGAVGSFGGRGEDNPHGWGLAWYSVVGQFEFLTEKTPINTVFFAEDIAAPSLP
jgi:predicted glutamine amidotransferase